MPSASRHVQIVDRHIATQSLTSEHVRALVQTGTGTPPASGSTYITFPTAYGTPPYVDISLLSTKGSTSGKGVAIRWDIPTIRAGSFVWQGTPATRVRWRAIGFRTYP